VIDMTEPALVARDTEENPLLPAANCERVSGYGVMGLTFRSGHVLGLRRWTASSVGDRFTSIWHRDPEGRWTFYETVSTDIACSRYFGADVDTARVGPIGIDWKGPRRLRVYTLDDQTVDWTIELGSTAITRTMSMIGSALPVSAWRWPPMLSAMGWVAERALGAGKVQLTGLTSNGQRFDANPMKVWYVTQSQAVVEGQDLGPIGPLAEQAHLADFYLPQRGIFAKGRVFVTQPAADGGD
jgi:hypothetical protein